MISKNAIEIIIRDINDLNEIVSGFRSYEKVPQIEIDICKSKLKNLEALIEMFEKHNDEIVVPDKKAIEEPPVSEEPIKIDTEHESSEPKHKVEVDKEKTLNTQDEMPIESQSDELVPNFINENEEEQINTEEKPAPETKSKADIDQEQMHSGILADKLKGSKQFMNEKIGQNKQGTDIGSKMNAKAISDIGKAISINDRFLFIKELFKGNTEAFKETVNTLNQMNSLAEAEAYINQEFNWENEQETAEHFFSIIKRKFI